MIKKSQNRFILMKGIIISLIAICMVKPLYSQSSLRDTTFHPYHVNCWVTGGIFIVGVPLIMIGAPLVADKSSLTKAEIDALDRNNFTAIDRWALRLDPSKMGYYANLSDNVLAGIIMLPALTLFDHHIRQDWLDVAMMYAETQIIVNNIYLYSPFGPLFQNRLRPAVYYDALGTSGARMTSWNRSSFYSGHVASAAAASFFTAKILCDYYPGLGWKKYLLYGAAAIPPLVEGYLRMKALDHFPSDILVGLGVGAICGIVIPEIHRIKMENVSMGLYSSFEGTGIRFTWQPEFGK
ncbi:MAG: phosphatase PAP2 family protein [Ignavibacteriae bacterium]|nr:MAG: phosphatase PAP2 family protein [Ignavibacteriota bacterium]